MSARARTVAALRDKALDHAVEVAALVRHRAARLLADAAVAEDESDKILHGKRCNLRPDLEDHARWRQSHGAAAFLRPLEIVWVERLLQPFLLGAAQLWQPVRREVVSQVFRADKVDSTLVRGAAIVEVDVDPDAQLPVDN